MTTGFDKAAGHLMAAASQLRKFGPDGEPAARELQKLAGVMAGLGDDELATGPQAPFRALLPPEPR